MTLDTRQHLVAALPPAPSSAQAAVRGADGGLHLPALRYGRACRIAV